MCFACVFGGQTYLVRQSFFFKMTSKPNEKMVKAEMNDVHQMFARKAEELNQKTVVDKKLIRSRNRLSGFLLAAMVGGVCECFFLCFDYILTCCIFPIL